MQFPNRRKGPRKHISRALSKKHRELKVLKERFQSLEKKYKSKFRCLQRTKKRQRQQRTEFTDVTYSESPGKRTNQLMTDAGLNKHQRAKVRKQLLLANVMQTNVEKFRHGLKRGEIGLLRGLIGGKILRKYKLARAANKSTGLGRNRISNVVSSVTSTEKRKRNREIQRYKDRVIEFLTRDDNSRCNPGKQDKMKVNGDTHQTRLLTDYLKNLHSKLLAENPDVKLSLASFCKIRPSYVRLTRFISRSCCLCTKHKNFALCTSALRRVGVTVHLNPERFIEDETNVDRMKTDTPEEIDLGQWKRVAIDDHGRKKMIMKVVSSTMKRDEFLKHMDEQIESFTSHVQRVKRQYTESLQIKKNLPSTEVVVNMDFAENYAYKSVEEIQAAYWNQSAVTLHPVEIYYKDDTGDLKHASIVIVSDEMGHNTNTVITFLDRIVPEVKNLLPNVNKIHYYTGSPTSQYRNKTIFHLVANHKVTYGCKAIWNFFEAGHGKGPCDGLGGTTKRMADEAVKTGKVTIQDADDFFQWTQSPFCSLRTVKFIFVPSKECQLKTADTGRTTIKPVKGTMKIHAVVGKGHNTIETSTVSCYFDKCVNGEVCDKTQWTREELITSEKTADMNDTVEKDNTLPDADPK